MLDNLLTSFLITAQNGSFSKAANQLFLTPNAVKKRIESLEAIIQIRLFERNNKGVTLTKAGQCLFNDLMLVSSQIDNAIEHARSIQEKQSNKLLIGIMDTFSDMFLSSSWLSKPLDSSLIFHLVRYGDSLDDLSEMLNDVGKSIDVAIDLYNPKLAKQHSLKSAKVSDFSIYIGLSKELDSIKDIGKDPNFCTVDTLYRGRSNVIDEIVKLLKEKYQSLKFEEIDNYHFWVLQNSFEKGHSILVCDDQKRLFPHFNFYKINYNKQVSFAVYYKRIDEKIERFMNDIQH